jgi:hypothetical protein
VGGSLLGGGLGDRPGRRGWQPILVSWAVGAGKADWATGVGS